MGPDSPVPNTHHSQDNSTFFQMSEGSSRIDSAINCAVKTCDSSTESFPLQYSDCQLVQEESEYNADFIVHMLERLDWNAVLKVAADLGNTSLPPVKPENLDPIMEDDQAVLRDLHSLLVETQIMEGKMTCRNCNHIYFIKNSIPNFLLPPHLC